MIMMIWSKIVDVSWVNIPDFLSLMSLVAKRKPNTVNQITLFLDKTMSILELRMRQ